MTAKPGSIAPPRILRGVIAALIIAMSSPDPACSQTAADIPLWYDVGSGTPPNIKINQDATTQLQNEEQVAVDPTNPNNMVAVWRDFRLGFRQVGWGYTHDGGVTWTEGGLIAETPYNRDSDPGIVANSQGLFYSVILSFDQFSEANGLFVPVSFDSGQSWLGPIVGVETLAGTFEDKELMASDNTGGPKDGNLYIAWTRFGDTTGIFCVSSTDGTSFGPPVPVSDRGSVQWPTPVVGTDGEVMIAWQSFGQGIMCDVSYDAGQTWGTDRVLAPTAIPGTTLNGGILTFAFPALAVDITGGPYDGRFYCAFTDLADDGSLDLFMTFSDDVGQTWSPRQRLSDDPVDNGADQFHPWTSVNPDGVVSVAFYDRRLDPNNLNFDLWITHSFDGGATWTPNQRVSNVSSSPFDAAGRIPAPTERVDLDHPIVLSDPQAGLIGEYIGLTSTRLRATTVFTDTRNGNQDVFAANMPLRLFPPRPGNPPDQSITNDPNVSFEWTDWSIYDSDLTYALEYSEDPSFTSGVTRINGISDHSHVAVLPDGYYYWRVRAFDSFGDSSGLSPVREVWVDATPPTVPVPIPPSPLAGDTITDPTPEFFWSAVTVVSASSPTPVTYQLEVASDATFTADLRSYPDLETASFLLPDPDALAFDQHWFWRVSAADAAGNESGFSDPVMFYLRFPFLVGDLNDDGLRNAVDLTLLIDVVYFGGAVPAPPEARADLDCNGVPNAVDLTLLINHVFFGGPDPACP